MNELRVTNYCPGCSILTRELEASERGRDEQERMAAQSTQVILRLAAELGAALKVIRAEHSPILPPGSTEVDRPCPCPCKYCEEADDE